MVYAGPRNGETLQRPKIVSAAAAPVLAHANIADFGVKLSDHPHLTIAAGLKPAQFATAWHALSNTTFSEVFAVEQVMLMKRELSPTCRYAPVRNYWLRTS
ncbi:MAG: hypothetical protein IPP83_11355 [Flavobacteriales bacterium]|nr:hypothetical protein [Flavobacteriales bacterium]